MQILTTDRLDQWQSGKSGTGSRVQSFSRTFAFLSLKSAYNWINNFVSKETINVYVKLKITRLNKLDYAKNLSTGLELMT